MSKSIWPGLTIVSGVMLLPSPSDPAHVDVRIPRTADFLTPLPADVLLGRGLPGDGHVDFPPLVAAVEAAGYRGDIEVEVFNADVWAADGDAVIATMLRRYVSEVLRG